MAADNCSLVDPWPHRRSDPWFSDGLFARDNEALTRALRISISNSAASSSASDDAPAAIASPETLSASTSSSPSLFNQVAAAGRRRGGPMMAATGRVAKRKSRASKRIPTTYINADPANFREMVQRVTGVRTNADAGELAAAKPLQLPLPLPLPLPPALQIRAGQDLQQVCLPTLDTSAFLLDRSGLPPPPPAGNGDDFCGPVVEVDPFLPSFPTLESWGVI